MEAMGERYSDISQSTKQQILDVARRLFSDRSYLGVSMSDIAESVKITKAALYYHFRGKREIYLNVLEEVFADLCARLRDQHTEKTPDERLRRMVCDYLQFGMREKSLINTLVARLSPGESDLRQLTLSFREELVGLFQPAIERVVLRVRPVHDVDGCLLATMLTAMMDGLILEHSVLEKTLNPERVAAEIVTVLGLSEASPCL